MCSLAVDARGHLIMSKRTCEHCGSTNLKKSAERFAECLVDGIQRNATPSSNLRRFARQCLQADASDRNLHIPGLLLPCLALNYPNVRPHVHGKFALTAKFANCPEAVRLTECGRRAPNDLEIINSSIIRHRRRDMKSDD